MSEVAEIVQAIENRQERRYLKADEAMVYMGGISKSTLWKWVNELGLPQVKVSGVTLYDKKDMDKFMEHYKL